MLSSARRRRRSFIMAALSMAALSMAVANVAVAKPKAVTIDFVAEVAFVDDPNECLCVDVAEGDVITGTYAYRASAPDTNPDPTVGDYEFDNKNSGIFLNINGETTGTDPKNANFLIELVNRDIDNYLLRSFNNVPLSCGTPVEHIAWQLDDNTGTALSSDALPTEPPDLNAFESLFGLTIQGSSDTCNFFIRAHVISAMRVD
jgi:hypothetical protein